MDWPPSVMSLGIVVAAILPGSMYTWGFERQVSAFGVTLADRVLRFIAISVLFHLVLGWGEYWGWRVAFAGDRFGGGQFAVAWAVVAVLVLVPAALGTLVGGLWATRTNREGWSWARRALGDREEVLTRVAVGRAPAPRAWDQIFSERPSVYVRVKTVTGDDVGGVFAQNSYAGGYPHGDDLLLEQAYSLRENGALGEPLGYPVYLAAGQVAAIEIVDPTGQEA